MAEDRTDEILSAIATLSERLSAVEMTTSTIDRKLNAIARRLLAPAEVIALGIQDARSSSSGGGGGEDSGAFARAAKPRE